jgi:cytochrome c biogenesis protein CcdA
LTALLLSVFGLALLDSINPSALAVTLYLLVTERSAASKVLVYVGAVFVTYLAAGALLLLGLDTAWGYLDGPVAYAVQGVVGAGLLLYGVFAPAQKDEGKARAPRSRGLAAVFLLGVTITVVEFSTAFPYLGAIALLTRAGLAVEGWLPVLVAYNLIFVLPPLLLLASYRFFGPRLRGLFDRYREKLQGGSRSTTLWVAGIVGFLLLADSLRYFGFFGLL